jgi:hypothetical protein
MDGCPIHPSVATMLMDIRGAPRNRPILQGKKMEQDTNPRVVAVALITAMLLGCQPSHPPSDGARAEATSTPKRTPATLPPPAAEDRMHDALDAMPKRDATPVDTVIDAVILSADGDTEHNTLGAPTTRFGPTDSVYAEIRSNGTASSYTIYAKWTGANGEVLADYGIKVNEAGPNRTVISLSKPDGWPAGQNKIELAINGKTLRTVTFDVQ